MFPNQISIVDFQFHSTVVKEYTLCYFYHLKLNEVCFMEEQTRFTASRRKKIIKRMEINEIENQKTKEIIRETKS